jgi:hypothetical protein
MASAALAMFMVNTLQEVQHNVRTAYGDSNLQYILWWFQNNTNTWGLPA